MAQETGKIKNKTKEKASLFKETQLEQGLVSDRFASFSLKHSNNEKLEEKTLGEIYDQAEKGVFSKKLFIFNNG